MEQRLRVIFIVVFVIVFLTIIAANGIHDISFYQTPTYFNGIRIEQNNSAILSDPAEVICNQSFVINYKIKNTGYFKETVNATGSILQDGTYYFKWQQNLFNVSAGQTSPDRTKTVDYTFPAGYYNITINAEILNFLDNNPFDNIARREIKVICEGVACYNNTDCGDDECAGGPNYCCGKDICQVYLLFTCNKPGALDSFCSNQTAPVVVRNCGEEFEINKYCYNETALFANYSVPYCDDSEIACKRRIESRFNQSCEFGCEDNKCSNLNDLSCEEAKDLGLIRGEIVGNKAFIVNNYSQNYDVGLAVYKMFGEGYINQTLFDSDEETALANSNLNLSVNLPNCKYQIDLFCGDVIENLSQQLYGSRKFDAEIVGEDYCVQDCEINTDCGNESFLENYCSGDDLYSNYSFPVCIDNGCELNYTQVFNQSCEFGCEDGSCLQECVVDSDCGNESKVNNYCSENNAWANYSVPSCIDNKCHARYEQREEEVCEFSCDDGECSGECSETNLSNCGEDYYSSFFCSTENNSVRYHFMPSCTNWSCSYVNETETTNCSFGCENGSCLDAECTMDENCSGGGFINNYCYNNSVFSNYSYPKCLEGRCGLNYTQILNESCSYGCFDGRCLPTECSIDADCGNVTQQFMCTGNNITRETSNPRCLSNKCGLDVSYEFVQRCETLCWNGECKSSSTSNNNGRNNVNDNNIFLGGFCGDGYCNSLSGETEESCADCRAPELSSDRLVELDNLANLSSQQIKQENNFPFLYLILALIFILTILLFIVILIRKFY